MDRSPMTRTMTCAHCSTQFRGNPRSQPVGSKDYCSIACEEGRGTLPDSSPQSPNYWLHVRDNPNQIVGSHLIAAGLQLFDYSPDWSRGPEGLHSSEIHDHMPEKKLYVRRLSVVVGKIASYDSGLFTVEQEDRETGEVTYRSIQADVLLDQFRRDQWWVEG